MKNTKNYMKLHDKLARAEKQGKKLYAKDSTHFYDLEVIAIRSSHNIVEFLPEDYCCPWILAEGYTFYTK